MAFSRGGDGQAEATQRDSGTRQGVRDAGSLPHPRGGQGGRVGRGQPFPRERQSGTSELVEFSSSKSQEADYSSWQQGAFI